MEKSLQNRSVGDRIDTVQKHGTIEELARKVSELSATVLRLEKALASKDAEIAKLRSRKPSFEIQDSNSVVFIPETPATPISSNSYTNTVPTQQVIDSIVTDPCTEWFTAKHQSKVNSTGSGRDRRKKQEEDEHDDAASDESMSTARSGASGDSATSANTRSAITTKRNHPKVGNSSDSQTLSPKAKRKPSSRKTRGRSTRK